MIDTCSNGTDVQMSLYCSIQFQGTDFSASKSLKDDKFQKNQNGEEMLLV